MSTYSQNRHTFALRPKAANAEQGLHCGRRCAYGALPTGTEELRLKHEGRDFSVREVQLSDAEWDMYFARLVRH